MSTEALKFYDIEDTDNSVEIPFFDVGVSAGYPSQVYSINGDSININRELVVNKSSTFCVRVNGQSMINAGIDDGDLMVVDKSLHADDNSIILAVINGEYTVKRLKRIDGKLYLQPENDDFSPILITEHMDFRIWGVVTGVIKKFI